MLAKAMRTKVTLAARTTPLQRWPGQDQTDGSSDEVSDEGGHSTDTDSDSDTSSSDSDGTTGEDSTGSGDGDSTTPPAVPVFNFNNQKVSNPGFGISAEGTR